MAVSLISVSTIHMAATELTVFEDEESAFVEIVRTGLDLSRPSSVWCTTKMLSQISQAATPSEDYVPISRKILFDAGQRKAVSRQRLDLYVCKSCFMHFFLVEPFSCCQSRKSIRFEFTRDIVMGHASNNMGCLS